MNPTICLLLTSLIPFWSAVAFFPSGISPPIGQFRTSEATKGDHRRLDVLPLGILPSPRHPTRQSRASATRLRRGMLPDSFDFSSSLLTAVEVFDGSEVVDPVVVSGVFWSSLKAKLFSVFIGQVLAMLVFLALSTLAAQQISRVSEFVSEKLFANQPDFRNLTQQNSLNIGQPDFIKLLICILIDIVGTSSEVVPLLGELSDIAWAPLAGLLLRSLYGSNVVFALEFAEEILPFTDFLPLATICWVVDTFFAESNLARLLRLGQYGQVNGSVADRSVIDIESQTEEEIPRLGQGSSSDQERR